MSPDDRRRTILKAVVDEYIATAEPVGSTSIVSRYQLNLSSATVRNILADLKERVICIVAYLGRTHSDRSLSRLCG